MAKVEWNDNKKSQHAADQKMILATHRVAATEDTHCNRLYIRGLSSVTRSTVPQAKELAARSRFASVAAAVKARGKDLMQQATDIADFLAQKDTAGGKKTMKAYLWKVCGDAYDAALAGA